MTVPRNNCLHSMCSVFVSRTILGTCDISPTQPWLPSGEYNFFIHRLVNLTANPLDIMPNVNRVWLDFFNTRSELPRVVQCIRAAAGGGKSSLAAMLPFKLQASRRALRASATSGTKDPECCSSCRSCLDLDIHNVTMYLGQQSLYHAPLDKSQINPGHLELLQQVVSTAARRPPENGTQPAYPTAGYTIPLPTAYTQRRRPCASLPRGLNRRNDLLGPVRSKTLPASESSEERGYANDGYYVLTAWSSLRVCVVCCRVLGQICCF